MPRDIFLIRYPGYPFNDHWALFVPSVGNPNIGTKIHVEGDVRNGFALNVQRNHNLEQDERSYQLNLIGIVDSKHVHNTSNSGEEVFGAQVTKDDIESTAKAIPPPQPSMRSIASNEVSHCGSRGSNLSLPDSFRPPTRLDMSDCQWWIRQVITSLVQQEILDADALRELDTFPKN